MKIGSTPSRTIHFARQLTLAPSPTAIVAHFLAAINTVLPAAGKRYDERVG